MVGGKFLRDLYAKGKRAEPYFFVARLACIPFAVAGALFCHAWGRQLGGTWGGLLAASLWVFSPNVLANAQSITPDMGAAAMGIGASYGFWRWANKPTWPAAFAAAVMLGLALLTKTTWLILFVVWPLGVWFLTIAGACSLWARGHDVGGRRAMVHLLLPAAILIAAVSSQTGFNHHIRYVLPAIPFLFVLAARAGTLLPSADTWKTAPRSGTVKVLATLAVGAAWIWLVLGSLHVNPHCHAYFNELAGGPANGPNHLLNSNVGWGRPSEEYANDPSYAYFQRFTPVDRIGYSIFVYHVTLDECNRVREELGLPPLPTWPPDKDRQDELPIRAIRAIRAIRGPTRPGAITNESRPSTQDLGLELR